VTSINTDGKIINRKFYLFLIPTIMSTIASSLSEFVDSIVVSRVLGTHAMTLINIGYPVMLVFSMIYTMLGVGGSVLFGKNAGEQNMEKAGRIMSITLLSSVALGLFFSLLGLAFLNPLCRFLCPHDELIIAFIPYMRYVLISGILIIPLQVIIYFLSAMGKPGFGMTLNVVTNVLNLVIDYIFIRYVGTGLKGASLATIIGYLVGILMVLFAVVFGKVRFPFKPVSLKDFKGIGSVSTRGMAPAMSQFGYCVKISFCNSISLSLAGIIGASVFSLCMQAVSIASIFIAGIVGAMMPIASSLQGQRDFGSVRELLKTVMKVQFIANIVIVAFLELCPDLVMALYNVHVSYRDAMASGLRIFSMMFLFRGFILVFMYYFQVSNRKMYATIISIIDGFAGIIPIALILTSFMGITGLWLTFPILAILMLASIVVINLSIVRKNPGRFQGIMLIEKEADNIPVYEASVELENQAIAENSQSLQAFCEKHLSDETLSVLVAVAAEEMSVYSMNMKKETSLDELDILVKIYPEEVLMDFRSMGKPFDISTASTRNCSNAFMLKKIASSVEYVYIVGMNQTRIRIKRNQEKNT
ncbi:MAG: hypothetical protein J6P81_06730, partial [Spirochaetales bacterium]|nr:hypothetical protein [Spirochaetales bacterium]